MNLGKKEDLISRLEDFEDLHGPGPDDVTHPQHTQAKNLDQKLKKILGPKNYFLNESPIREKSDNESYDIYNDNDNFQVEDSDVEETQHKVFEEGRKKDIDIEIGNGSEEGKYSELNTNTKKITLNSSGNKTFGLSLLLNPNK